VLTGIASIHGEAVMKLMSQRDSYGVNVVVLQELGMRVVPLGNVVFLHVLSPLFLKQVRDSEDFNLIVELRDSIAVRASDSTTTDDSNP
jgi:hypothetical protein